MWRLPASPLVVDLGYGASPVTAVELHSRLRQVRPRGRVVGIEISPSRVSAAKPLERDGLSFRLGGFELPVSGRADVVRAFNVLRQYDESSVPSAWATVMDRLAPQGILIDGTCNEVGRLATWVTVDRSGPVSLTLSWHLGSLSSPSVIAERLPKALIHRNVPGERVFDFLSALEAAWERNAPLASYGKRQRFVATCADLARDWPLIGRSDRWRLGELSVRWDAVAPRD